MIRPLEYCENTAHLTASIETIDARILELTHLRKQYIAEKQKIVGTGDKQAQQLVEINPFEQNEQE